MKKFLLIFLSIFFTACEMSLVSNMFKPAHEQIVLCDSFCMQEYINKKDYEGFMKNYDSKLATKEQKDLYYSLKNPTKQEKEVKLIPSKVAILIPQKTIKNKSLSVINAVLAYVLNSQLDANIKIYYSGDESANSIKNTLTSIRNDGYKYIIAAVTEKALKQIAKYKKPVFYLPLVSDGLDSQNVILGGINYKNQINELLKIKNSKIAIFGDDYRIAGILSSYIKSNHSTFFEKQIIHPDDFVGIFDSNISLNNASLFLNTAIPTSVLILHEANLKDYECNFLATQINYNDTLIKIANKNILKNVFVANSISGVDTSLQNSAGMFGIKLLYDEVAYSTMIGFEYFQKKFFGLQQGFFDEEIKNNKVDYKVKIFEATPKGFLQLKQ